MYLSTVLDDFSRYIIAWKLCANMGAEDVTDTLDPALKASGCDSATVVHMPRLLSDNGPSYIASELARIYKSTVIIYLTVINQHQWHRFEVDMILSR
jgi:putative transposase